MILRPRADPLATEVYLSHFSPTSPVVSVLLSAHNAEKTLRRAIESVQNQTLRNLELIAVDAASEDSSARMLDTAMERDIRVVVLHAAPMSHEEALNVALDRARGDYLFVMPQEGWLEPAYLQKLVDALEKNHADLVLGGFEVQVHSQKRTFSLEANDDAVVYRTQQDFRANAWRHLFSGELAPATGKLFVRDRVAEKGLRFDPGSGADHSFTLAYVQDVERAAVVDGGLHIECEAALLPSGLEAAQDLYSKLERSYVQVRALFAAWGLADDSASSLMLQTRYLEMLALCVEAACMAPASSDSETVRQFVARIISNPRAIRATDVAQPRDPAARALLSIIKSQNVSLAVVQTKLLALLRHGIPTTLAPDSII